MDNINNILDELFPDTLIETGEIENWRVFSNPRVKVMHDAEEALGVLYWKLYDSGIETLQLHYRDQMPMLIGATETEPTTWTN